VNVDRPASGAATERVPTSVRWFVAVFFAVFVASAVGGLNLWPFSGWRLFSQVRTGHVSGWTAEAVDAGGRTAPVPFGAMPRAYASFGLLMRDFPTLPVPRQVAMCEAWLDGARAAGTPAVSIRLVRVERDLVPRAGQQPARDPVRRPVYECGDGWIHTIGSPRGPA